MAIEYLGLSNVNGPLVVLEGVQNAFFDEIVEFTVGGKEQKLGRIVEVNEDKAVIQVFEGTENVQMGWLASQADMLAEDWMFAD